MPKPVTGEVRVRGGVLEARITIKGRERRSFPLPHCQTREAAKGRASILAGLAQRFRKAGIVETNDAARLLEFAANAPTEKVLQSTLEAAEHIIGGDFVEATSAITWGEVADDWVKGKLHREYPDHVKAITSPQANESRVKLLKSIIGDVAIESFCIEHAEHALKGLPKGLSAGTRRHYGQVIRRVLALCVYPLKLIPSNPVPTGFLPKSDKKLAKQWLYPKNEARLLACTGIPLHRRVYWAFLYREGLRASEAEALEIRDVDLEHGLLTLDKNKTSDPRAWALSPDVREALRIWLATQGRDKGLLFVDDAGHPLDPEGRAELFRAHLELAGIKDHQPLLFESTDERNPIRVHDQRAAFVTLALAAGKSESWISDRTGHQSSQQINGYHRQARTAAELNLGGPVSMVDGIPELAAIAEKQRQAEASEANTPGLPQGVVADSERPTAPPNEKTAPIGAVSVARSLVGHEGLEPSANGLRVPSVVGEQPPITVEQPDSERGGTPKDGLGESPGAISDVDPVEHALATAITKATEAGQWEVVAQLAGELKARRKARQQVVSLAEERRKRRGKP